MPLGGSVNIAQFKTCVIFIPIFSVTSVKHPSIFNLGWKFARKFHNDTRNGRNVSEIAEWYCSRQSVSQHDTLSFLKISAPPPPPPPFHCQKRNVMHWLCSRKKCFFFIMLLSYQTRKKNKLTSCNLNCNSSSKYGPKTITPDHCKAQWFEINSLLFIWHRLLYLFEFWWT